MTDITIGFEISTGKEVAIKPNHLVITGKTRVGKSQLMQAMIQRSEEKILVLDVKDPPDYDEFPTIPLYIKQAMSPLKLKNLMESTERMSLKFELPELSRMCRISKTWTELLENIKKKQTEEKLHPVVQNVLETLSLLFEKLNNEFQRHSFSEKVETPNQVNVMPLSDVSRQLQQVIVASVAEYVLRRRKNVTTVMDEAHRFIPQAASSAAREEITILIREGAAKHNYLWIADQTVTGIDKEVLKQVDVWILGRQTEKNEADRILDQIPQKKDLGISRKDIQTLGLGEFIVVTQKWAKKVYSWPTWIPRQKAIEVAKGNMTAEEVAAQYEHEKDTENEDDMYKKQYEELYKDHEKLKKKHNALSNRFERLSSTQGESADLKREVSKLRKELQNVKETLEPYTQLKKNLREIIGQPVVHASTPTTTVDVPEGIEVSIEQPAISIVRKQEKLVLSEDDLIGKIAIIYANDELPRDKWFTSGTIGKIFKTHAWPIPRGAHLSNALNQMTQWRFFKKQMAGKRPDYRINMLPEEAQDKGLLVVKEE